MKDQQAAHDAAFTQAYNQLNPAQRQAVDEIEGPVMVVAGPGTGKTQILTLRIANILRVTQMTPQNILALTFTESGAKAMRERLLRYIGAAAYQVPIFTFHGFAAKLISDYPDAYVRVIGGRPASDLDKIKIIEQILQGGEVKLLRPFGNPTYYVPHILRIIGQLKQEYVTPDSLVRIIEAQEQELNAIEKMHTKGAHKGKVRGEYTKKEQAIAKNRELLFVYRRYESLLGSQNIFDFEDMIIETVQALQSNESMLRDLQETYQYILADEHQDVNGSQNKILELLASFHDFPNIFAVGDEKQAIYRFQGASLENFLYFTEQFPGTKVIHLTENYRSGQTILDAAHSLVAVEEGPLKDLRIPLVAKQNKPAQVMRRDFSHQVVEDDWLVSSILADSKNGISLSEIAVIVRTNKEVELIAARLRAAGMAVTASADGDVLQHPILRAVESLIQTVVPQTKETALFQVLHGAYWGIGTDDLLRVLAAQSYERSLYQIISNEQILKELGVVNAEPILRVSLVIDEAKRREVHESPHRVLEYVLKASGFINHLMVHDPFEGVRVVRRIYDEIESMVSRDGVGTLAEVSLAIATRRSYGLPLTAPYIVTDTNSVQVMTAHKSKGLEFEVVYVPHVHDAGWSGATKKRYFDIPLAQTLVDDTHEFIEDERRLLYVAMTRAKQVLSISCSGMSVHGRELLPARLLEEVDSQYITSCEVASFESQFDPVQALTSQDTPVSVGTEVLKKVLAERGLSATSLNNYLSDPWDYFFRNVLRIPETQAVHMQFGTAIHAVLEYVTRNHSQHGTIPSDTQIKQRLESALNRLPVNVEEYTRLLEKGLEALMQYIPHMQRTLPAVTKEEVKFRVSLPTGISEFPEVILTGNIDRIDFGANGVALRVVDYKTGKPKSRNVVEGNTKNSDGGYKRQLVFYALLLKLFDDERYICREGMLSFVEPDTKGQIHEEVFTVSDQEIEALKTEIIEVVAQIIGGEFLTHPCDGESEYKVLVDRWRTI